MTDRLHSIRRKIKPEHMPAIYADVSFDGDGRIHRIEISEPGKFSDTAIGRMVADIAEALNTTIEEIHATQEANRDMEDRPTAPQG